MKDFLATSDRKCSKKKKKGPQLREIGIEITLTHNKGGESKIREGLTKRQRIKNTIQLGKCEKKIRRHSGAARGHGTKNSRRSSKVSPQVGEQIEQVASQKN